MNVPSPVDRCYAQLLSLEAQQPDSRAELPPTRIRLAEKLAERDVVQDPSDVVSLMRFVRLNPSARSSMRLPELQVTEREIAWVI